MQTIFLFFLCYLHSPFISRSAADFTELWFTEMTKKFEFNWQIPVPDELTQGMSFVISIDVIY
jgi:hypothetical protein